MMSTPSAVSSNQSDSAAQTIPTSVNNLLAAINADDAEGMAAAFTQVDGEGPAAALAAVGAIVPAGLTKKLLDALVTRGESLNTAEAWKVAAEAAFLFQDEEVAQSAATEALKRDPAVGVAAFVLATIGNRHGRHDEALKIINNLLAVAPQTRNDPYLIVQLALAKIGVNQPEAALSILDGAMTALTNAGLGCDAQLLRARALKMLPGRSEEALEAWKNALSKAAGEQKNAIRYEFSGVLWQAGQYDEALQQLDLAVQGTSAQGNLAKFHEARSNIYFAKGDLKGAIGAIEDQLANVVEPDQRIALRLAQARLEVACKEWKDAAARFDSALAEVSQDEPQKRLGIHLAKAQALATYNYELVTADLDELDKAPISSDWPLAFDARVNGLLAAGRPEEAWAWLNNRLASSPQLADHPAAHQVRAEIQMKLGNAEAALEQYSQAMAIPPDQTDPRAWGAALLGAIATQQWAKATAIYEQFFKTNPAAIDAPTRVFVAVAYARNNQPEKALVLTEQKEALPPHMAPFRLQARAEAQMRLGRYEAVLRTIDEGSLKPAETAPDALLATRLMRIQALNQLRRYAEARNEATRVLDSFSDSPASLAGLMQVLKISVRVQRSLSCYSLGEFGDAHTDIDAAISEFDEIRLTPAIKVLEKAADFSSLESSMWFAKGAVLEAENRGDESLTAYTRSFALETNGAAATIARGSALTNIEAFTDAVIAFDVALARVITAKERATALAGKGLALVRLRRYEQAIKVLRAAVDARLTEPSDDPVVAAANAAVFEHLGIAYNHIDRNGAALNAFERAWELTRVEKRDRRKANVARGIAAAHLKMGNPTTALEFIDKLSEDLRAEPTLMFNRALALVATGKQTAAMKILVIAKNSGLREAQELLDRLDRPSGLNRWTRDWLGVQVSWVRWAIGIALLLIAVFGLVVAPFYQWRLTSKLDWYWLLIPSAVALLLFALPSLRSIKAAGVELSADPLPATGRDASTPQTSNLPTITTPIAPK